MFLYTVIEAVVAVIAGVLIAVCTKRAEGVTYTKADDSVRIMNILLTVGYVCLSPFYLFLGMIARPQYNGLLGVLGWVVSVVMASAALFCGLGIGFSVAFRKRGKRKQSFYAQFAGVFGITLTFVLFISFYGNLLKPIN